MRPRRWSVVGALLAVTLGFSSRARAHTPPAGLVIVGVLLPSDLGVEVPIDSESRWAGLIGWSYQLGLHPLGLESETRHRGIAGVDLLINGDGASGRGRVGYRYAYRDVFGGVGTTLDGRGFAFSPELGVKFLHDEKDRGPSLHATVRAAVGESGFESVTFLFGWNLL